jgi:hypothetical protein
MSEAKTCPKCGVPLYVTQQHLWLNNGDIVQRSLPVARLVLAESQNIDPLFRQMEKLMGAPVEPLVIAAAKKAGRQYLLQLIPEETRRLINEKRLDPGGMIEELLGVGYSMGMGAQTFVDMRYERDAEDYFIVRVANPFSIFLMIARFIAGVEAISKVEQVYDIEQVSPDVYEVRIFPSPGRDELRDNVWLSPYEHADGPVDLERCSVCGGPALLSGYSWDVGQGIITDKTTGRRTAMIGNTEMELVFEALEEELGGTVPRVAVEVVKDFTKENPYSIFDWTTVDEFRGILAVRGVGHLEEMEISRKGLNMRIANCALPLFLVGIMQGVFEKALKKDSVVEWDLSPQHDLAINIIPVPD